jgi:hydrogenase nickel incorporation protein HypA/HybF
MHETAVIVGLLRILSEQAALHHVEKITRVRVKVGRLRAVEPQALRACFEVFSEGTLAEGAELVVDEVRVRGRCQACGREFDVPRYRFECPDCHGSEISVLAGQELYIENFETVT